MSGLLRDAPRQVHPAVARNFNTPIADLLWDVDRSEMLFLENKMPRLFLVPPNDVIRLLYVQERCLNKQVAFSITHTRSQPFTGAYSDIWEPFLYDTLDDFVKDRHPSFCLNDVDDEYVDIDYLNFGLEAFLDPFRMRANGASLGEVISIAMWWLKDFTTPVHILPPTTQEIASLGGQAMLYRAVHMASGWSFDFSLWVGEILSDGLSLEEAIEWTEKVLPYLEAGVTNADTLNRLFELDIDTDIGWALVGQTAC